jgi:hypothetical protein
MAAIDTLTPIMTSQEARAQVDALLKDALLSDVLDALLSIFTPEYILLTLSGSCHKQARAAERDAYTEPGHAKNWNKLAEVLRALSGFGDGLYGKTFTA